MPRCLAIVLVCLGLLLPVSASAVCDPSVGPHTIAGGLGLESIDYRGCRWDQPLNRNANKLNQACTFDGTCGGANFTPAAFATLPACTPLNYGSIRYCSDCVPLSNPCEVGGEDGTGSFTFCGGNGWECGSVPDVVWDAAEHTLTAKRGTHFNGRHVSECSPEDDTCWWEMACNRGGSGSVSSPIQGKMRFFCDNSSPVGGTQFYAKVPSANPFDPATVIPLGGINFQHNGTFVATRPTVNLVDNYNATFVVTDDPINHVVSVSVSLQNVVLITTTTVSTTTTTTVSTTTTATTSTTTTTILQAFLPEIGGVRSGTLGSINQLNCMTFKARHSFSALTKLAAAITNPVAASHCGVALYSQGGAGDPSAGTRLALVDGACTAAGLLSATGLTSFAMTSGNFYTLCACTDTAAVQMLTIDESGTGTGHIGQLMNAFSTVKFGFRNSGCSGGIPPSPLGSLTATNSYRGILAVVAP